MAYSEQLADRIRKKLSLLPHKIEEKKMMGGLTFMVNDKMCAGILKDELMCRINPELHDDAVEKHGCREMDFTGRPMRGFVLIEGPALNEKHLDYWLGLALEYNKVSKSSKKKITKHNYHDILYQQLYQLS